MLANVVRRGRSRYKNLWEVFGSSVGIGETTRLVSGIQMTRWGIKLGELGTNKFDGAVPGRGAEGGFVDEIPGHREDLACVLLP